MKKINLLAVFLFAMNFFGNHIMAQLPKVFLPMLETINLKKDFQYSTSKLLKSYIENANRYQVVMQEISDSAVVLSDQLELVKAKAKEKVATYFITGSLNRLGETVIVNINLYETESLRKVWFDQLKAFTPDDLDPVLQRFGANIGSVNKAATNDDIYSVTAQESKTLQKKETNNYFGVGLIGAALFESNLPLMSGLSAAWSFDARNYIFDIRPSWSFSNIRDVYSLSLEMAKPIKNTGNTPYYGGGLSFSRTAYSYDPNNYSSSYSGSTYASGYGLMLLVGGGYIFNRTSSVSLRVSANYFQGFYDVKSTDNYNYNPSTGTSSYGSSQNYGTTQGALVRLEILFGRR
jgi:hypothetical protein